MKQLFLLFTLLTLSLSVFSQKNKEFTKEFFSDKDGLSTAKDNFKQGLKYFDQGRRSYPQAIESFLKANIFNPDNDELNYKLGIAYLGSGFKSKCLEFFEKANLLNPKLEDLQFYLGRGYHLNLQWDKAIDKYKLYRNEAQSDKDKKDKLIEVNKMIQECEYGKEYVKHPVRVFIDNLGSAVNSKYSDFSPVISADESIMFFTSRRENTTGGGKDEDGAFFEDIYYSKKVGGEWGMPVNMGSPINSEFHDATAGLSADGQKLYVFDGAKGNGDIYFSTLNGEKWSKLESIGKNINTEARETSVCLSPDENTLFFVSEREDGKGGRDIWISKIDKKGKKWTDPVNAGNINTPYSEESVYMHPDGKTLYFSSQGFTSMGGYDIFKTTYENGTFTTPENLGYPVNSPDDDVFLVISASGLHGYYASFAKDGIGEKDLMMISFLGPEKPVMLNTEDNLIASQVAPQKVLSVEPAMAVNQASATILKGVITDLISQQPVEADIELVDNMKNELIATFKSNSKSGKYLVSLPSGKNYGIAVKHPDYLFHSENFDIPVVSGYQEVEKNIQLKKIAVGAKIVLRNIFFDFDKATLRPESTAELERLIQLLKDVPTMRIEISGHTDSRGADDYNLKLSDNRAKAVVEYLVSHGISGSRLEYKGYGETQSMSTNDTDEGRQLNRRTEFKILSK